MLPFEMTVLMLILTRKQYISKQKDSPSFIPVRYNPTIYTYALRVTRHIQLIVNLLPDSLQHIRCYSSQSSHNSILQVLQIPGQWRHVDSVFHIASQDVRSGDLGGHQSNGLSLGPRRPIHR
jgi:hypothetical protein